MGVQGRLGLRAFHHGQQRSPRGHTFLAFSDIPSANVELSSGDQEGLGSSIERGSRYVLVGVGGPKVHIVGAGKNNLHRYVVRRDGVGVGHLKLSLNKDVPGAKGRLVVGWDVEFTTNIKAIDFNSFAFGQVILDALAARNDNWPGSSSGLGDQSRHETVRIGITLCCGFEASRVTLERSKGSNSSSGDVESTTSRPAIFFLGIFLNFESDAL